MSYILDALRRADAERQRGQVPGLGAQPAAAAADTDAPRPVPAWGLALGTVLAVAVVLALVRPWRSPPAVVPAPAAPAVVVAVPAPPAPLPVVVSAPPAAPPVPVTVTPAAPLVAAPVAPPAAPTVPSLAPRLEPAPTPLAALSADQRRELPPLALGGSIWSDNAAQRFIIVNGQVVHEGEAAAPGVVVERIGPKAALLRWRELRIELPL